MNEVKTEFDAAIATARYALEEFKKQPMCETKRGGPRVSPWFRIWRDASEIAQRWHRRLSDDPEPSVDDVIDRLLADGDG
jgi:hypothetical protein